MKAARVFCLAPVKAMLVPNENPADDSEFARTMIEAGPDGRQTLIIPADY
jgi:hypothetical protein